MNREVTQTIASEVQLFQTLDQKENFLFLIGALLARVIVTTPKVLVEAGSIG